MQNRVNRNKIILVAGIVAMIVCAFVFEYFTNDARNIPKDQRVRIDAQSMQCTYDYEKVLRIYTEYENSCEVYVEGKIKYVDSEARIIKDKKNVNGINISSYVINEQGKEIQIKKTTDSTNIIKIEIDNRYIFNYRYFAFALLLGLLGIFSIYFLLMDERKPENIFIVVGLIVVLTMASSLPISTVDSWDEHIHYSWVRQTIPNKLEQVDYLLGNQDLSWIYDSVAQEEIINNSSESSIGIEGFTEAKMAKGSNPIIHFYNYIAYYPTAIMVSISKLIGLNNSISYILGRIINGLIYVILCYYGIRRIKSSKVLAASIALIPLAMFQASVYTYDWWVTGFLFLGSAYLIAELQEPKMQLQRRNFIIIIVAFVLGCGPKAIYFPLILLMLLFDKDKYYSNKQHKYGNEIIIGAGILVLMSFLLPFLIGGPGAGDSRGGDGVNAADQMAFIFGYPVKYTIILLKAIASYINPLGISYSIAELGYIAQSKTAIILPIGCVIFIDIILATFCDRKEYDRAMLTPKNRAWTYICLFAIVCLIETALYISYTTVGGEVICGVQRRYLLPIFLLAFALMGSKSIIDKTKKIPNRVGILAIFVPAIMTMLEFGYMSVINFF